jgi:hypothetical protein
MRSIASEITPVSRETKIPSDAIDPAVANYQVRATSARHNPLDLHSLNRRGGRHVYAHR